MTGFSRLRPVALADGTTARFLRFLGTGVVNTGFGYAVFLAGLLVGLPPAAALTLQFLLGVPFNFLMHGRLVFGNCRASQLPLYALAYLCLYGVNLGALGALMEVLDPAVAQAVLVLPMAALAFLTLSRIMR